MAQYDVLVTQNVHATLVEYQERFVAGARSNLITFNISNEPVALAPGTAGYVLKSAGATGDLYWDVLAAGHTQNTDIGTTSSIFELDSDGTNPIELTAEAGLDKLGVRVNGGATFADIEAKDATFAKVTVVAAPSAGTDLTNKTYVDGLLASNDAMIFKGTVGTGGTHTIAAFNALATYDAGWTYRIIEAGTVKGNVVEVGDMIIAMVDRAGSGELDADWTVVQTNLDGAVIGPASSTAGYFAIWNGTTGKLLQDGGGAPGTMAYETATNYLTTAAAATTYVAQALFDAQTIIAAVTDDTPAAVTVAEQTIVGRITSGNIAALTAAQVMGVLWQAAPATPTSTGTVNQIAFDEDYFYICTATNTWRRAPLATTWV